MTETPQSHNFDWVTARHQCSVANEFVRLKELVEKLRCNAEEALCGKHAG